MTNPESFTERRHGLEGCVIVADCHREAKICVRDQRETSSRAEIGGIDASKQIPVAMVHYHHIRGIPYPDDGTASGMLFSR